VRLAPSRQQAGLHLLGSKPLRTMPQHTASTNTSVLEASTWASGASTASACLLFAPGCVLLFAVRVSHFLVGIFHVSVQAIQDPACVQKQPCAVTRVAVARLSEQLGKGLVRGMQGIAPDRAVAGGLLVLQPSDGLSVLAVMSVYPCSPWQGACACWNKFPAVSVIYDVMRCMMLPRACTACVDCCSHSPCACRSLSMFRFTVSTSKQMLVCTLHLSYGCSLFHQPALPVWHT
jgi:hypothetical protein